VRAVVRHGTPAAKTASLAHPQTEIHPVDYSNPRELIEACSEASVVVCTMAGLRDVIVDTQLRLLNAAVEAGVPRFIPSDFAIDFTRLPDGSNRNLDLRREFQGHLDKAPIKATSILNGAFTDMLTGVAPFILFPLRKILCWGGPDQKMDWTAIADTARFTARAAVDPSSPRWLRIAGDELSARDLANLMTSLTGKKFSLLRPGGLGVFRALIAITKATTPKSDALYPPWQGMQYMHNMYSGLPKFPALDNDRYPMTWTTARDILARHLQTKSSPGSVWMNRTKLRQKKIEKTSCLRAGVVRS
jgi:nucleoside-diphosphate-sugar epimerase